MFQNMYNLRTASKKPIGALNVRVLVLHIQIEVITESAKLSGLVVPADFNTVVGLI